MNCPSCQKAYSDTTKEAYPRVLINCGHTFCHNCIASSFRQESIQCFNCGKINIVTKIEKFPINQQLMNIVKKSKLDIDPYCKLHNKKIEIYCEKDQKLLCSECIIHTHQHHKMRTVTEQAEKERFVLYENLLKVRENLQIYKNDFDQINQEEIKIQHAFLDCQSQTNIFFQTIAEEITRLKARQIQRLQMKKEEALKKLSTQKYQIQELIKFFTSLIDQIEPDLAQLNDTQFLMQIQKRNFFAQNTKVKKNKINTTTIEFKKNACLQQISKSIQEMLIFQNNRNANQINSMISSSPMVRKQKEPAVLEVNLNQQYQKRKISIPIQKSKPTKKTIYIQPDKQKISQPISSARNSSFHEEKPKIQSRGRQNSMKSSRDHKQFDSFLQQDDYFNLSQNFTPLTSMQSFMRTSRQSLSSSFVDDISFKNTFRQSSLFEGDYFVYHIGGVPEVQTEKYCLQTGKSQRITSNNSHLSGRGFQCIYLKTYNNQKCLLFGGVLAGRQPTNDIYEFSFKDHRITKSLLRLPHPKSGFRCVVKDCQIYTVGGKIKEKAVNVFQRHRISSKELITTKMPSMEIARENPGCSLGFDGKLYSIGGVTLSNDATNSVQRFNWDLQLWESVKPMRFNRINFAVVSTPKGIFAIGGHTTKRYLNEVEFYDLQEQKWIEKAKMKTARSYHTAIISKDYQTITVFGGLLQKNELDSIEIYDIKKNEWRSGGVMKSKRCLHVSILSPK